MQVENAFFRHEPVPVVAIDADGEDCICGYGRLDNFNAGFGTRQIPLSGGQVAVEMSARRISKWSNLQPPVALDYRDLRVIGSLVCVERASYPLRTRPSGTVEAIAEAKGRTTQRGRADGA